MKRFLFLFLYSEYKNNKIMTTILFPDILHYMLNDSDNYVASMTSSDLHARKCLSTEEYIHKSLADFNINETMRNTCYKNILQSISVADTLLSTLSPKFYEIPWSFVLFSGRNYENGYPHTRFNSIFLPIHLCLYSNQKEQKDFIRTLIHEKIHLFQKMFPHDPFITSFMSSYEIIENKNNLYPPLVRANPDTDNYIYKNIHTNEILCFLYKSGTPSSIGDVIELSKYEHPYEAMSYIFAEYLKQKLH